MAEQEKVGKDEKALEEEEKAVTKKAEEAEKAAAKKAEDDKKEAAAKVKADKKAAANKPKTSKFLVIHKRVDRMWNPGQKLYVTHHTPVEMVLDSWVECQMKAGLIGKV